MLWVCETAGCGTRYAVGLGACPHCGGTKYHQQRPEDDGEESATMAKIGRDVGPSDIDNPSMPPVINEDGERFDRQDAEKTDAEHVSWTDQGRENLIEGVTDEDGAQAARTPGESSNTDTDSGGDETDDSAGGFTPTGVETVDLDQNDDDAAEEFDPGRHTVSEVNQYLEQQDDPVERQRVIDAERAGRNRSGIRATQQ